MFKRSFTLLIGFLISVSLYSQTTVVDSIIYGGVWRNYRIFLPTGFNSSTSLPLVFNLHGYGSNALEQELYSRFDLVADTAHFILCYPNGLNNSWNIIGGVPDDVGYIDTLITILQYEYNINTERVYSTGLSNGGFLSNMLACRLSNKIAAVAPVAGTNIPLIQSSCSPSRLVPILYIHGTADGVVDYNGTASYVSASDLMNLWASNDGCSSTIDTFLIPDNNTADLCTAERITWHNCDSSKEVIHYRIVGGGHTWPGAQFSIGVTNEDFDASSIIWEFFNRFSLSTGMRNISVDDKIIVSPNPIRSIVKIELDSDQKSEISLFSSDGRLINCSIHFERNIVLDQNNLPVGLYFLKIYFSNKLKVFRIIKIE